MDLFKAPGIAETLDWAEALVALDRVALDPQTVADTAGVLLKYQDDIGALTPDVAARLVAEVAGRGHPAVTHALRGIDDGAQLAGRGAAAAPKGRLAENVVHFVRVLRAAGLPVGPARTLAALEAVEAVGLANREDFRAALAAVLVSRHEQLPVFEQAFDLFWRNPKLLEKLIASLLPTRVRPRRRAQRPSRSFRRESRRRCCRRRSPTCRATDDDEIELDAAFTMSPREVLQHKDFETMTAEELAAVRVDAARPAPAAARIADRGAPTPSPRGHRVDLRATLRRATGAAGTLSPLAWRAAAAAHAAARRAVRHLGLDGPLRADAAALPARDHQRPRPRPRAAVRHAAHQHHAPPQASRRRRRAGARRRRAVSDWAGGTRIGACLEEFNRRWSRRLLGQNAVVLLISDGLDAEGGAGLGAQMERLHKSCRRLVWLNPLLRYEGFEARPAGIRAMLPHVDDFLPVHNLESLTELAAALDRPHARGRVRRARAPDALKARRWR